MQLSPAQFRMALGEQDAGLLAKLRRAARLLHAS
jgi:hypothetical protein